MANQRQIIDAVAKVAEQWSDPDYPKRIDSVERTLQRDENYFTEESIAFDINQTMSLFTPDLLQSWIAGRSVSEVCTVGVISSGVVPIRELRDVIAVLLCGHRYLGCVSPGSPFLIPDFCDDLIQLIDLPIRFNPTKDIFNGIDAVIAAVDEEESEWVEHRCEENQIPVSKRMILTPRASVAVIDGKENEDEREDLAEDILLFEGMDWRSVRMIWAPKGLSPDALLDTFARFRAVYPVHPRIPQKLKMQKAFLKAEKVPHAYGEGLEFLISKGDPEFQQLGHIRWVEYSELQDAQSWIDERIDVLELIVARRGLSKRLRENEGITEPGHCHRPPLDWRRNGTTMIEFLISV